ncbi:MAG TPA: transglutaminase-like domain-containing protein [Ramlibacter sp.]|nr:transglutaminase-like domain-containing protein [Ramlibacter sp.]
MALSAQLPPGLGPDDPQLWLGPSALMDLEDPKLRLRVQALTQLCKSEREKAVALYGYVKRLPLARRFKTHVRTAREVFDAGRGDAPEKATLLVAMLRIAGIPARVHWVVIGGEILRGIAPGITRACRPIVETWLHERWLRTDTFIFDPACMAAARQRLRDRDWEWGYGIHVGGHMVWNGYEDAFLGGVPTECDLMVVCDLGVFHDTRGLIASRDFRRQQSRLRMLYWNVVAPLCDWAYRGLRNELSRPPARPTRKPS